MPVRSMLVELQRRLLRMQKGVRKEDYETLHDEYLAVRATLGGDSLHLATDDRQELYAAIEDGFWELREEARAGKDVGSLERDLLARLDRLQRVQNIPPGEIHISGGYEGGSRRVGARRHVRIKRYPGRRLAELDARINREMADILASTAQCEVPFSHAVGEYVLSPDVPGTKLTEAPLAVVERYQRDVRGIVRQDLESVLSGERRPMPYRQKMLENLAVISAAVELSDDTIAAFMSVAERLESHVRTPFLDMSLRNAKYGKGRIMCFDWGRAGTDSVSRFYDLSQNACDAGPESFDALSSLACEGLDRRGRRAFKDAAIYRCTRALRSAIRKSAEEERPAAMAASPYLVLLLESPLRCGAVDLLDRDCRRLNG